MFTWSDRTGRLAGTAVTRRLGWEEILGLTQSSTPPAEAGTPAETLLHEIADESLDVLDLALALEVDFSVVASELKSGKVRSYGELTDALLALTRARAGGGHGAAETEPFVWARIAPANGSDGGVHAGVLSNDAVRILTAAALEGGRGTTVEITVAAPIVNRRAPHADASVRWIAADTIARVESRFAALAARGIVVTVQTHAPERTPEHPRKSRESWWNTRGSSQRRGGIGLTGPKVAIAS